MPQYAGFVGVLLTSCARETRMYVSTCVCVAGDLECTFLAQSTIGRAKIAGENCQRENMVANGGERNIGNCTKMLGESAS